MSKIEECYDLFRKYCEQELIYFSYIALFEDESGSILDAEDEIILDFDNFQECIDKLKEKLK